ncbi:MAG: YggS family pyridoxal phosphate-dependent enzyme [Planctomycetes bacterium]|nr:YggS family pyridoxal phosphate-dependent enzyme [Planctomycetota bacterium]
MPHLAEVLERNVAEIRGRIADAARRCGRNPSDVRLVGVTKYVTPEVAQALVATGVRDLGESRPQQLWAKAAAMAEEKVSWHLIGSLQRNKVRRTVEVAKLIHSLDSARLADAIHAEAVEAGRSVDALVEVNISGDATKHGVAPDAVRPLMAHVAGLDHLRVRGLMTMSHLEGGAEIARQDFAKLRELRDRLRVEMPPSIDLTELSMGMSDDFEQAVQEGATIVRVGSALFRGL